MDRTTFQCMRRCLTKTSVLFRLGKFEALLISKILEMHLHTKKKCSDIPHSVPNPIKFVAFEDTHSALIEKFPPLVVIFFRNVRIYYQRMLWTKFRRNSAHEMVMAPRQRESRIYWLSGKFPSPNYLKRYFGPGVFSIWSFPSLIIFV